MEFRWLDRIGTSKFANFYAITDLIISTAISYQFTDNIVLEKITSVLIAISQLIHASVTLTFLEAASSSSEIFFFLPWFLIFLEFSELVSRLVFDLGLKNVTWQTTWTSSYLFLGPQLGSGFIWNLFRPFSLDFGFASGCSSKLTFSSSGLGLLMIILQQI